MNLKGLAVSVLLYTKFRTTDASSIGLTDPRLCYILDGILFIYGIIITALYIKLKLSPAKEDPQDQSKGDGKGVYQELNKAEQVGYDEINRQPRSRDLEAGQKQRKKRQHDPLYTSLNKKEMSQDEYSAIGGQGNPQKRRGKGNEAVYQGLSHASKDTYDSLQMQPLPPQ